MQKSFTLIELLVVIAIIGLLASVVLVSMGGVKTQASMTQKLEFSGSVQRSLGAYALGIWSFDEGSGDTAYDASGYGNNGIISGAVYTDETPQKIAGRGTGKYALSFDGSNDYVNMGSGSKYVLPNNSQAFSFEMWVYPTKIDGRNSVMYRERYMRIEIGYSQIGMEFQLNGVAKTYTYPNGTNIASDTWTHLVFTYDNTTGKYIVYLNGVAAQTITGLSGLLTFSASNGYYLSYTGGFGWLNYYKGILDEVRIYEKALSLSQIQQHYAEGLEKHQNLAIK